MFVLIKRSASLPFCSVTSVVNGSKPANSVSTGWRLRDRHFCGCTKPGIDAADEILAPSGVEMKRNRGGLLSLTKNVGAASADTTATAATVTAAAVIAIQRPLA